VDHGGDFGSASAAQYEQSADMFLNSPLSATRVERIRQDGDIIRFDILTNEFAVKSPDGYIRTYYKPNPAIHGQPSNYDYYLIA
jgi:filamentous hemagglutinin